MPALIVTAVFVLTLFLIVYLQYGTVDLVMMICDKHRYQELGLRSSGMTRTPLIS